MIFCVRKIRVKKIKNKNNFEDELIPNLKWIELKYFFSFLTFSSYNYY